MSHPDYDRGLDDGRLYLPDPIVVTLSRPASYSGGPATSVTVAHVQEQIASQDNVDHPLGGTLDGTRRTFNLWLVECLSLPPFASYEITKADGTVWVIKSVETCNRGRRFRCQTLQRNDTTP